MSYRRVRIYDALGCANSVLGLLVLRVAEFTHGLETMLELMRQSKLAVSQQRVTLLLEATDVLRELLDSTDGAGNDAHANDVSQRIGEQCGAQVQPPIKQAPAGPTVKRRVRVTIAPQPELFATGIDPLLLMRDLAKLGELEGTAADLSRIPLLDELNPEHCYMAWTTVLTTSATDSQLRDVFLFVEDICNVTFTDNDTAPVERRGAQRAPSGQTEVQGPPTVGSTLKVPTTKVDALIDLVGEIVIAQSMVKQLAASVCSEQSPALQDAMAVLEQNTLDLQERVMAIRMVPVDSVFARFPRLVRDLASAMGKDVALELFGQDTELDKGMIERLADPLTHMLRNALDHGIETPEARVAAGKPARATIRLSACHSAGGVVIELSDDGRGLNAARIRAKAEAAGLIQPGEPLTDEQIYAFIFEPGFSTADTITDVSGRGVGMDVVKRTLDALNGTLNVTTVPAHGTTFRIKLPLTLAIMDGLSLRVGNQKFVVPLLSVTESLSPSRKEYKRVAGRGETIVVREQVLPLLRLSELFKISGATQDPTQGIVIIVETEACPVGLLVDALLGQSQVVLKSLESHYKKVEGIMGATILGDGQVSLILDVPALCRLGSKIHAQRSQNYAA